MADSRRYENGPPPGMGGGNDGLPGARRRRKHSRKKTPPAKKARNSGSKLVPSRLRCATQGCTSGFLTRDIALSVSLGRVRNQLSTLKGQLGRDRTLDLVTRARMRAYSQVGRRFSVENPNDLPALCPACARALRKHHGDRYLTMAWLKAWRLRRANAEEHAALTRLFNQDILDGADENRKPGHRKRPRKKGRGQAKAGPEVAKVPAASNPKSQPGGSESNRASKPSSNLGSKAGRTRAAKPTDLSEQFKLPDTVTKGPGATIGDLFAAVRKD